MNKKKRHVIPIAVAALAAVAVLPSASSGGAETGASRADGQTVVVTQSGYNAFYNAPLTAIDMNAHRGVVTGGDWTFTDGVLRGNNSNLGDTYYMTDISFDANSSFVFEATVEFSAGAAGIVILPNTHSLENWYCLNKDCNANSTRLFSIGADTAVGPFNNDFTVSNYNTVSTFRLEAIAGGYLTAYLNGSPINTINEAKLTQGWLGVMTWLADARFYDIKYSVTPKEDAFESVSVDGQSLTPGAPGNAYSASAEKNNYNVTVAVKDGYTAYINGVRCSTATVKMQKLLRISAVNDTTQNRTDIMVKVELNGSSEIYSEEYRPQFHFSPKANWMNDPNGFVYDEETGEYHIFYQYGYYIDSGATAWGHAVTTDFVHYEELEPALDADDYGWMWSGCGVVDRDNTSGLFDDSTPAGSRLVLVYSPVKLVNINGVERRIEQQALAYSKDHGRTWTKYNSGKPVIDNADGRLGEMRDGKIIWLDDESQPNGGVWLLITAGYTRTRLWTSHNLIDWKLNSEVLDKDGDILLTECPDIFELPVDGDENNKKWVISAGGTYYVLGTLKKKCGNYYFQTESDKLRQYVSYNGPINGIATGAAYATVSFFNDKYDRRIMASWMVDHSATHLPDKGWNGCMSSFMETTLRTVNGEIVMCGYPIEEYESLRQGVLYSGEDVTLSSENALASVASNTIDAELSFAADQQGTLRFEFAVGNDKKSVMTYNGETNELVLDLSDSGILVSSVLRTTVVPIDGKIDLRIFIDRTLVEIYANGGRSVVLSGYFPPVGAYGLSLTASGEFALISCNIYEMGSSWEYASAEEIDTLFLGDSYMEFWKLYGVWDSLTADIKAMGKKVANAGVAGTVSTYWDGSTRVNSLKRYAPEQIVFHIGVNDIDLGSTVDTTYNNLVSMFARYHTAFPDAKLYWVSLIPNNFEGGRFNADYVTLNGRISALAESLDYLEYIDVATAFTASDGGAKAEYLMADGLHLNPERGYPYWTSLIKQAIYPDYVPSGNE